MPDPAVILPLDPVAASNPSAPLEKRKAWISPKQEIGMLIHPHSPCAQSVLVMSAYATKMGCSLVPALLIQLLLQIASTGPTINDTA
jgi:hypothetical protein